MPGEEAEAVEYDQQSKADADRLRDLTPKNTVKAWGGHQGGYQARSQRHIMKQCLAFSGLIHDSSNNLCFHCSRRGPRPSKSAPTSTAQRAL
jgi:hypothetical protein